MTHGACTIIFFFLGGGLALYYDDYLIFYDVVVALCPLLRSCFCGLPLLAAAPLLIAAAAAVGCLSAPSAAGCP